MRKRQQRQRWCRWAQHWLRWLAVAAAPSLGCCCCCCCFGCCSKHESCRHCCCCCCCCLPVKNLDDCRRWCGCRCYLPGLPPASGWRKRRVVKMQVHCWPERGCSKQPALSTRQGRWSQGQTSQVLHLWVVRLKHVKSNKKREGSVFCTMGKEMEVEGQDDGEVGRGDGNLSTVKTSG